MLGYDVVNAAHTGRPPVPQAKIKTSAFLANLPLFKALAPQEIERIAAGTTELHADKGAVIFRKGDPVRGFHVVVYGQVKLAFVSPGGAEKVVEIINPGMSFGEALLFADQPYVVTAQTLADTLLLHVARETVEAELARDPGFARKMLAGLSRRMHSLIADVEAYSLQSGRERVIGYLLRDIEDVPRGQPCRITLATSKAIVASRLNLTPEHFSRILHELVESGLIVVDGREIGIPDVARLQTFTG